MQAKKIVAGVATVLVALSLSACSSLSHQVNTTEQRQTAQDLQAFLQTQPIPNFGWSQLRQTLIQIERAQATTVATTSFGFEMGIQNPVWSCPSVGFPVASTTELTNPKQVVSGGNGGGSVTIGQIDPNGVYAGNSTGTYVLCTDAQGRPYVRYEEGYVSTVTGPAVWDAATHQIQMVGAPTGNFTVGHAPAAKP